MKNYKNIKSLEKHVKSILVIAKSRRLLREWNDWKEIEILKAKLGDKFNSLDPYSEEEW